MSIGQTGPLTSGPPKSGPAESGPLELDQTDPAQAALSRSDRFQPVVLLASVGLGLALAKIAPSASDLFGALVSVGVFALIYLVMLSVDLSGIARAFDQRQFLVVAVTINFIVNPLIAWGLGALFLGDEPELWVGLMLFLVTPCVGWYLIFTELAGGDAVLGVSLLAVNIVLQLLLLPVYLWLLAGQVLTLNPSTIASSVGLFLVLPLAGAALTRSAITRSGQTLNEIEVRLPFSTIKTGALVMVIVSMFASQGEVLFENPAVLWQVTPPILAFFVVAFGVAIIGAKLAGQTYEQAALLVFTTTSRNSEASLAIAATAFTSPLVALTVVIGPVIELPLLVVMVHALKRLRPLFQSSVASEAVQPGI